MNNIKQKALVFAMKAHEGQFRKDGKTPYIVHPINVATMLEKWGLCRDNGIIAAAYLHDVLEDTDITLAKLKVEFGDDIAWLVDEVTFHGDSRVAKQHWLDGFIDKSRSARLIKVADRICNVEDFINDGKKEYAMQYLHYADNLFNSLKNSAFGYSIFSEIENLEIRTRNDVR